MPKTRTQMLAMSFAGGQASRKKFAGTDFFRVIGAAGGRAGRGSKKPRISLGDKMRQTQTSEKKLATMQDVLAELE